MSEGTEAALYYQLTLDAPEQEALMLASALENYEAPAPKSVSVRRTGRGAPWRIEAILKDIAMGVLYTISPLAEEDWVALAQDQLPPIRTRRFYVRSPHLEIPEDVGSRHVITIEPGLAFGTGHHGSTLGCLLMMESLVGRARPKRILDLGTGTGLLAIAAERLWPEARILACDNDRVAVDVARINCRLNEAPRIRVFLSDGYRARQIRELAPFDLVVANILAEPLLRLAQGARRHIRRGGHIILAGLLDEQAAAVLAAYRGAGFKLLFKRDFEGWTALTLERV
jgi:ribosomal protein L11 methyltransferase